MNEWELFGQRLLVRLDLLSIPQSTRTEMTKELELRFQQLQILLQAFHTF